MIASLLSLIHSILKARNMKLFDVPYKLRVLKTGVIALDIDLRRKVKK